MMLSHGAILSNCKGAYHVLLDLGLDHEVFLSFLPLSIAAVSPLLFRRCCFAVVVVSIVVAADQSNTVVAAIGDPEFGT